MFISKVQGFIRKIPCPIKCVKFIVVDNQNFGVGTPWTEEMDLTWR